MLRSSWLLTLLGGCTSATASFDAELPATGVARVFADADHGSFVYVGGATDDQFAVDVVSTGRGSSEGRAQARLANNDWGAQVTGELLDVWARTGDPKARVDIGVSGPTALDVEVVLLDGWAELYDVDGFHVVTADAVVGSGIRGDVDFYANRSGIDVEVFPGADSLVRLQAYGDVALALPYGLDYDLEVFADPDWGVQVSDLGFDTLFLAPDYVSAQAGTGAIRVEVFLSGGAFLLWEAVE